MFASILHRPVAPPAGLAKFSGVASPCHRPPAVMPTQTVCPLCPATSKSAWTKPTLFMLLQAASLHIAYARARWFIAKTLATHTFGRPPCGVRRRGPQLSRNHKNCQHGGGRAKLTRFAHNVPLLSELALLCPGESAEHRHEPWTRAPRHFATSEEKVYPRLLCQRLADVILRASANLGYAALPLSLSPGAALPLHEAQAAAGLQPAGRVVLAEYKQIVVVHSAAPLSAGVRNLEEATTLPPEASCSAALRRLPAGSRVLRHSVVGVSSSATQDPASADDLEDQPLPDANMDPEEFSHYAPHLGRAASDEAWRECIHHLCDLLKSEPPSRGGLGTNKFSWSCGVYFHANKVGLRTNTNLHPNVCKLLCEYVRLCACVRRMAPGHPFTSLMLDKDLVGRVHADKNNATGLPNAVKKFPPSSEVGSGSSHRTAPSRVLTKTTQALPDCMERGLKDHSCCLLHP